jgi:predicted aspartyl protease
MNFELKYGIPFVEAIFKHKGKEIVLKNVVIDTGSGATIFPTEIAIELGLESELQDTLQKIRGIGGTEFVYEKVIDSICLGDTEVKHFKIQIGAMNYGFGIDAIIGMNFLHVGELVIDCGKLKIIKSL